MAKWSRKHDLPGTSMTVPQIEYPSSLRNLIDICISHQAGDRLHPAGSHWALSTAAASDHTLIETNAPNNRHVGLGRTLHEVVPGCLSDDLLTIMANKMVPQFEDNEHGDQTPYFVHVESGKRIYQTYAELDQDAEDNPDGLAALLHKEHNNGTYYGAWAFPTLGGAGGQTVFGALTTGTHGGDFAQPPIADSVAALHLVTDGGMHYWIEPATQPENVQLTDDARLQAVYGTDQFGGAENFAIVRDDDLFNAVLVSVGRFGVVYSVVLRAVRQYMLRERVRLDDWQNVRPRIGDYVSDLYTDPPQNRFLQVAVCLTPHSGFTRNRCGITRRWTVKYDVAGGPPAGRDKRVGPLLPSAQQILPWPLFQNAGTSHAYAHDPNDPNRGNEVSFLERACSDADFMSGLIKAVIEELKKFLEDHEVAAGGAIAAVGVVGGAAGLLALAEALLFILALLIAFVAALDSGGGGKRMGQVLDDLRGQLLNQPDPSVQAAGVFVWQMIAYALFKTLQQEDEYDAISYAIMDRHDYLDPSCQVNVDSIEVFFSADDPMLLAFIDALIVYEIRQEFQGKAFVGYASMRFMGPTRALIGPQRWPRTCSVEVAGLKDVSGVSDLIDYAITLSRNPNFSGILHWGQRNESNAADIEFRFGDPSDPGNGALGKWRNALNRVTDRGDGFSSAFTRQTGLEVV